MRWNQRAEQYDEYYEEFRGAVEHHVDWELLRRYLPRVKTAQMLDAAGGTGRIALPLARMGYSVTLCDISPRMLEVARRKMLREGLVDRVAFSECDVWKLPFADESFDFALCYGGGTEAIRELARVTKRKGKLSLCMTNRYGAAVRAFHEDPERALAFLAPESQCGRDDNGDYLVVSEREARRLLQREGVKTIGIYAYAMWDALRIPGDVLQSRHWDATFFKQTADMMLGLAEEPSVRGVSRHWVVYGEKTHGGKAAWRAGT